MKQIARFQDALAKLSWVEGRTIHIDYRFGAESMPSTRQRTGRGSNPTQTTPVTAALQRESRILSDQVSFQLGATPSLLLAAQGPFKVRQYLP